MEVELMSTRTGTSRGRRLLALSLATGTAVVAAGAAAVTADAAPATRSATTTDNLFSGTTDSSAVQLVVTFPAQLNAVFSQLAGTPLAVPNPLSVALIHTSGSARHDGRSADTSTATSDLINGSLVDSSALTPVLGQLKRTVVASLTNPSPATATLASVPSPNPLTLSLSAGTVAASASKADRSNAGTGNLASAGLLSLKAIGVPQQLQDALNQITAALQTVVAQAAPLTTVLNGLPSLPAVPAMSLGPVTGPLAGTPLAPVAAAIPTSTPAIPSLSPQALTDLLNQLPATLNALIDQLLNQPLITLGAASTSQSIKPAGSGTVSSAAANVGDINILGGLLTVTATKASAVADATGVAGKATSDASATLAKVSVSPNGPLANLLTVIADDKGLAAALGGLGGVSSTLQPTLGTAVAALNNGLNAALMQLNGLLQTLGGGAQVLQQGTVSKSVSPDGKHAEAHAVPAKVTLGLPGAANLVALSLGSADAVADRAPAITPVTAPVTVVAPPAIKVPTKETLVIRPSAPSKKLAFTGGDLPLTGGAAALLLLAGAGLARRRTTHHEV